MRFTKAQLVSAIFLLLDEALPQMHCKLVEQRGTYLCNRCDMCMFEQYMKRVKAGEKPKIELREAHHD